MGPKIATVSKLVGDQAMGGISLHGIRTLGCSTAQITALALGGLDIYWYVAAMGSSIGIPVPRALIRGAKGSRLLALGCMRRDCHHPGVWWILYDGSP